MLHRLTAAAVATAGLLAVDSNVLLEEAEKKDKVSELEPPKLNATTQKSLSDENTSAEQERATTTSNTSSSQSSPDPLYGIFLTDAVKQKILELYPSRFSNVYADHVLINNNLSPEDQIELEKKLGTKYQAGVFCCSYFFIFPFPISTTDFRVAV